MKTHKLMAHQVAVYPDREKALRFIKALIEGGTDILEIQIPFSDPSADGPIIQAASAHLIKEKISVNECFDFILEVHRLFPKIPIYLMSYASVLFSFGITEFVKKAKNSGVKGFIVPDLPFDSDEGLILVSEKEGLLYIPVITPNMSEERLQRIEACNFSTYYCAIRKGITGAKTEIEESVLAFLGSLKAKGKKVYGGFGIVEKSQAKMLAPYLEGIVAGSVFVEIIQKGLEKNESEELIAEKLQAKSFELSGKN